MFDEPIRGSASRSFAATGHIMVLGLAVDEGSIAAVAVTEDGTVTLVPSGEWTIDWRYVTETDRWMDLDAIRSGETDQG